MHELKQDEKETNMSSACLEHVRSIEVEFVKNKVHQTAKLCPTIFSFYMPYPQDKRLWPTKEMWGVSNHSPTPWHFTSRWASMWQHYLSYTPKTSSRQKLKHDIDVIWVKWNKDAKNRKLQYYSTLVIPACWDIYKEMMRRSQPLFIPMTFNR